MESSTMGVTELRTIIAVVGVIIFALIYFFGRPRKPSQGRRRIFQRDAGDRVEPTLGEVDANGVALPSADELNLQIELGKLGSALAEKRGETQGAVVKKAPAPGTRPAQAVERIVTLYVACRGDETMHGASLIVAAEKAGLVFGDKGIFHRLVSGRSEAGPIFSMANMLKPGNFDMREIDALRTPGLCFFMALPGPVPALDGWDALLPTAQRMAELLDATVLDEERNALGRQRIAHIRDELRAYDRKYESNQIKLR